MPKPYSLDLRKRVITNLQKKVSQKETAIMFSISIESVKRWWKIFQKTGSIKPKIPNITRPRKVNYEKVEEYVKFNSDKTWVLTSIF